MTATVLQPPTIQSIHTGRLFLNIDLALGVVQYPVSAERYASTVPVSPQEHFRITRLVLRHLLGDDIGFSTLNPGLPDADQERKLSRLYQSEKAWQLYTDAVGTPTSEITPWLMHQFFARIAWLNESVVTTEAARSQFGEYVYGLREHQEDDKGPDDDAYPTLGELLTPIPEDLRQWMVQLKRGSRLMPVGEWIARSSGRSLYNGLAAMRDDTQARLSTLCKAVSVMDSPGEYRDPLLSRTLEANLGGVGEWLTLMFGLETMPEADRPSPDLQLDVLTPASIASRGEFFRKIALYVLNPDDEAWLPEAIADAQQAPGLRGLSLAMMLRAQRASLTFDSAMTLATLLLRSQLHTKPFSEALPTAAAWDTPVPRLDTWQSVQNADELFRQLGLDVLCETQTNAHVLRWPAFQTWQALAQTAQFKRFCAPLLESLGWYGGEPDEPASAAVTQALAGRAIVDFFLGTAQNFSEPLAKTLYGAAVCEYTYARLGAKVRADIQARQPSASSSTVDLLYYLLLREAMPELLVQGIPDYLHYGRSLQGVALAHGVALVEAMQPGRSAAVAYDELIGLSAELTQSSDPGTHAVWTKTLAVPALRYAIAHDAIAGVDAHDIEQASGAQISQALTYLMAQQQSHAAQLNDLLSIKPPDRKKLAQQMLNAANVDPRFWDMAIKVHGWPILQKHGFTIASSYSIDRLEAIGRPQASIVELVMMGEVYIPGQSTIPEAYDSAFETYRRALVSAQAQVMTRLLSQMNTHDRTVLSGATWEVSRVAFDGEEGSQGIFIRGQSGDHREDFHRHTQADEIFMELIPASGVARTVTQRFEYTVELDTGFSGNLEQTIEKKERNARAQADALITPLLPFDSDGYLHGNVSRVSTAVEHSRKGLLIPGTELVYLAQESSEQAGFDTLARVAATHLVARFLEQTKVEHTHETSWEDVWATERRWADTAARLIIPFYGCVKDLVAGDRSGGVIAGCVMDVAFALLPFGQFAGSTARIVLRAGEMSVLSVVERTGKAVGQLIKGLAEQSAVFAVRDAGKLVLKLGRLGVAKLLKDVPALSNVFASTALLESGVNLDKGMYVITDSAEYPWRPEGQVLDARAVVDGRPDVAVRNAGTAEAPDFRLLDPESEGLFGKRLTPIAGAEPLELSTWSAADGIAPGHYPAVLPVTSGTEGVLEVRIAQGCQVRAIEREAGVFDILVDDQVYHLDANAPNAALRKLSVDTLGAQVDDLSEIDNLCRVRRDLESVPCVTGVKLATPTPEPVAAGSISPKRTGKYPSHAMAAREFRLDRLSVPAGDTVHEADVFVYEGKFCKWAESSNASTSAGASAKKGVVALSEQERALFALPESPAYLSDLKGKLANDVLLGLPKNFSVSDARSIYDHVPVIELGAVVSGIDDARTLRGIRLTLTDTDWIFVEPDTKIFYKARTPTPPDTALNFSRVTEATEIDEFMLPSEQYRLVREQPGVVNDQKNIARLLFELLTESERESWHVSWGKEISTYDDYAAMCIAKHQRNDLMGFAGNILAGENSQKNFVGIGRGSIPDFKKVAERSVSDQQHIVEVLNTLLPVQGSKLPWEKLDRVNILTPRAADTILGQVRKANLAFVQVLTVSGERVVYYALSGGKKAKSLKLQLDTANATQHTIGDVIFRDARARMAGRLPDPSFTSLPVVRNSTSLIVRDFSRQLDSERLIATVLKEDMAPGTLTHIKFFTVLDACRSCGGFVLPRLKLDFPKAEFSVTYLKDYTVS